MPNTFNDKTGHFNFTEKNDTFDGFFVAKAFDGDGLFWKQNYKNFDIFNDSGPKKIRSSLIVNATRLMRYITPLALLESRDSTGLDEHKIAYFKDCKDISSNSAEKAVMYDGLKGRLCPDWFSHNLENQLVLKG